MSIKVYNVISVMSGTSLDGIDMIYSKFWKESSWKFNIIDYCTLQYSPKWLGILKNLTDIPREELLAIDEEYTAYLAKKILSFIKEKSITSIDLISSHGHTALHTPEEGTTYQIGNLSIISELINQKVICDFRTQDVKLSGQGAPLVPIGDRLLFSEFESCLNLGGFANISFEENGQRVAFDICPVNIVLNHFTSKIGLDYDQNGDIAKSGKMDDSLLNQLNELEFYKKYPPKSLGKEWVNEYVLPLAEVGSLQIKDVLRTFVEHVAIQIGKYLQGGNTKTLITGGGAYNSFLLERIKNYSNCEVVVPDNILVEYKEALIFGLLGVLRERQEINCLSSVTGATYDHSSGVVFTPIN